MTTMNARACATADGTVLMMRGCGWLVVALLSCSTEACRDHSSTRARSSSTAPARLSGRVITSEGKPIAGAVVRAEMLSTEISAKYREIRDTTEDGQFAFDVGSGSYSVELEHRGFASVREIWDSQIANQPLTFVLVPESTITGRALLDSGEPLANVTVMARVSNGRPERDPAPILAVTNSEGLFTLRGLPSGSVELLVTTPNFTNAENQFVWLGAAEFLSAITLRAVHDNPVEAPTYSVAGSLTSGVDALVRCSRNDAAPSLTPLREQTAFVKAGGEFAFDGLTRGAWRLSAVTSDGSNAELVLDVNADRTGLVIQPQPLGSVSGELVDTQGRPIAGALIVATSATSSLTRAVSDARGRFILTGLHAGRHDLQIRDAFGALPLKSDSATTPRARSLPVTLDPQHLQASVRLSSMSCAQEIRGLVTEPSGGAVPFADVSASVSEGDDRLVGELHVRADARGEFAFTGLCRPLYSLQAEAPLSRLASPAVSARAGRRTTLQVVPRTKLRGAVRDGAGPVQSYLVEFAGAATCRAAVDALDGRFTSPPLPIGTYRVTVVAPGGYASAELEAAATPGVDSEIELVAWSTLRGRVTRQGGAAYSGATIALQVRPLAQLQGRVSPLAAQYLAAERTVGPNGDFEFPRLMAGAAQLTFSEPGQRLSMRSAEVRTPLGPMLSESAVHAVDLPPGEALDLKDIVLSNRAGRQP